MLRREVKLELDSLTDQRPTQRHAVRARVVDDFPAVFADWDCRVTALELPRTFWEKATILRAERQRPADQPMPDRYARHYSDMARLLEHPTALAMLADQALCARVVEWKTRVFARQWARYDLARPGTFRLLPAADRLPALARDYAQMRAMFVTAPPVFDAVLARLADAERTLNFGWLGVNVNSSGWHETSEETRTRPRRRIAIARRWATTTSRRKPATFTTLRPERTRCCVATRNARSSDHTPMIAELDLLQPSD